MDEPVSPQPELGLPRPAEYLVERYLVRVAQEYGRHLPLPVYEDGDSPLELVSEPREGSRQFQRYYFFRWDFPSVKSFKSACFASRES